MKKLTVFLASLTFLFWYTVVPEASDWCKNDSYKFRTSTSIEHSGDAAKTAKLKLCLLVANHPAVVF